jgi:hypothetical protein
MKIDEIQEFLLVLQAGHNEVSIDAAVVNRIPVLLPGSS